MRVPLLALGALLAASPAVAHPHLWIDARATLEFEHAAITGIALEWRFDDVFSDFVLGEYDKDGDGAFDAEETRQVEEEAFSSLAEFDWLTHLRVDGEPVPLPDYRDFEVSSADRIVTYRFVLPLPEPVDPRRHAVRLSLYDETYYIDVMLEEGEPLLLAGEPPPACSFSVFEDVDNAIYFGMVAPYTAELRCAGS